MSHQVPVSQLGCQGQGNLAAKNKITVCFMLLIGSRQEWTEGFIMLLVFRHQAREDPNTLWSPISGELLVASTARQELRGMS